jgi:tetratricopeptide (TPR) repeat protein
VTAARVRHILVLGLLLLSGACSRSPEASAAKYIASGDEYVKQKRLNEAILEYRNAVQLDPVNGPARFKLAEAYETSGDLVNAYREYVRAADAMPNDLEAQVRAAKYLLVGQQYEDARKRAEAALAIDPKHPLAQVVRGNSMAGLRDFDASLAQLEEAVRLDPTSTVAQSSLGAVRLARGMRARAEAAFREAIKTNPNLALTHLALANFLWTVGRAPEAEASLKEAVRLEPDNVIAHRGLATFYMSSGRAPLAEPHLKAIADQDTSAAAPLKLALADYYLLVNRPDDSLRVLAALQGKKDAASAADTRLAAIKYVREGPEAGNRVIDEVLTRDPKNVPALLTKTRFKMSEGQMADAATFVERAVAAEPQSIQARYLAGSIYRSMRRREDAIEAFSEVIKSNPRAAAAQLQLAELVLQAGRADSALQLANAAALQNPRDPRAKLTLAKTLIATGELNAAAERLADLITQYPRVPAVIIATGDLAMARKEIARAQAAYLRALSLEPGSLDAVTGLISVDFAQNRPQAAVAKAEARLLLSPNNPAVLVLAARVYGAIGDTEKAEALLRKTIDVDPANLPAYGMLGQMFASQRRLEQGRASFEAILAERPHNVPAHTIIAMLYEAEGNRAEARRRYERTLQIEPSAAVAANNLAYIIAEDGGNLEVALQLAQLAKQKLPESPDVADTLGWVYVKKNLASIAVPHLEEAVALNPRAGIVQYHLGVALVEAGERVKGREVLTRALELGLDDVSAQDARDTLAEL